jgi:hypothetical protein
MMYGIIKRESMYAKNRSIYFGCERILKARKERGIFPG